MADSLDLLRRWARLFDSAFHIPGTRIEFGLDPIFGLVPGLGDLASPILAILMLWHGARMRVPKVVLARMVLNALIDAAIGFIPIAGDAFDVFWKANEWNLALLERHAAGDAHPTSGDYLFVTLCCLIVIVLALVPVVLFWSLLFWLGTRLRA